MIDGRLKGVFKSIGDFETPEMKELHYSPEEELKGFRLKIPEQKELKRIANALEGIEKELKKVNNGLKYKK